MSILQRVIARLKSAYQVEAMTNLSEKTTGIPKIVLHVFKGGGRVGHGPRIKVSNTPGRFSANDTFSIPVDRPDKIAGKVKISADELASIVAWMRLNETTIRKFWSDDSYLDESLFEDLRKL